MISKFDINMGVLSKYTLEFMLRDIARISSVTIKTITYGGNELERKATIEVDGKDKYIRAFMQKTFSVLQNICIALSQSKKKSNLIIPG